MKISGKITRVMPLQEGQNQQGAPWRKLTIVVMEDDPSIMFPNEMALDLFNDKIPATPLSVGQHVEVYFGVRTREYNGRVFNDINVFKFN
jgi:hypothetical protein